MNAVDLLCEEEPPGKPEAIKTFVKEIFLYLGEDGLEISLLFCSDRRIAELNSFYRNKDTPTDVLSFSQREEDGGEEPGWGSDSGYLGDVVISLAGWKRNCADFGVGYNEEFKRLIVHGVLHLLGYDHDEEEPAGEMVDLQEEIMLKTKEIQLLENGYY